MAACVKTPKATDSGGKIAENSIRIQGFSRKAKLFVVAKNGLPKSFVRPKNLFQSRLSAHPSVLAWADKRPADQHFGLG
jgi:hypothetical protein